MKRLLVFVFAVVLLGSCKKRKTVYFETLILSNTKHTMIMLGGDMATEAEAYTMSFGGSQSNDTIPIAVGERDTSYRNHRAEEGDNIRFRLYGQCNYTYTAIDSIQCDFEILIGFFVDDVLIEERNISHSYSQINNNINEYVEENTIDFTVP